MYDNLSKSQKRWACERAKRVYLSCLGKTGRAASHADAVAKLCGTMSADSVHEGTTTLESLTNP